MVQARNDRGARLRTQLLGVGYGISAWLFGTYRTLKERSCSFDPYYRRKMFLEKGNFRGRKISVQHSRGEPRRNQPLQARGIEFRRTGLTVGCLEYNMFLRPIENGYAKGNVLGSSYPAPKRKRASLSFTLQLQSATSNGEGLAYQVYLTHSCSVAFANKNNLLLHQPIESSAHENAHDRLYAGNTIPHETREQTVTRPRPTLQYLALRRKQKMQQ